MAFPGGLQTFGSVARYPGAEASTTIYREDLLDAAINLDKEKSAAVFLAAPKTVANGLVHEWFIDTLPATSTAASAEGLDWASGAVGVRTRLSNTVQTFRRDFAISRDALEYSLKGRAPSVSNEYEHQVENFLLATEQSIDAMMMATASNTPGTPASATATDDAPRMLNMRGWEPTATAAAGTIASSTAGTSQPHIAVQGAWSRARFLALHEVMYDLGANPNTLAVSPGVKADITNDILGEVASASAASAASAIYGIPTVIRQVHTDGSPYEYTADIQFMRSDFGRVAILVDRFCPEQSTTASDARKGGSYFLYDRAKVRVAFWRSLRHYPLPPGGDSMRGYIHAGATMEMLAPATVGVGYCITT